MTDDAREAAEWILQSGQRTVDEVEAVLNHFTELGRKDGAEWAWVTDYDKNAPVDKSKFADPSIGNCPGCSNVTWHAKLCPWVAEKRGEERVRERVEAVLDRIFTRNEWEAPEIRAALTDEANPTVTRR
jgi:hypothetical protein